MCLDRLRRKRHGEICCWKFFAVFWDLKRLHSSWTVSYTHLDVYKRQVLVQLAGMSGMLIPCVAGNWLFHEPFTHRHLLGVQMCIRDRLWAASAFGI